VTVPDTAPAIRRRRRGSELEQAIYEAVLGELAATGYRGLTMEGIAARVGTGKASLYRRWPNKQELVLAALAHKAPELAGTPTDTGELRGDLVELLTQMVNMMAQSTGRAVYVVILESILEREQDPGLAAKLIDTLLEPRLRAIMEALRRAARRGEIPIARASELLARVGPALVVHQLLQYGALPSQREVIDIVDVVLLPALQDGPPGR
jgi:AcrR family transcriptional regulator